MQCIHKTRGFHGNPRRDARFCVSTDATITQIKRNARDATNALTQQTHVAQQSDATKQSNEPSSNFGPQSKNIASIIRKFKIGVTKYAMKNNIPFEWQSRYYDHIIRDENDLNRIRKYIIDNPSNWKMDEYTEV